MRIEKDSGLAEVHDVDDRAPVSKKPPSEPPRLGTPISPEPSVASGITADGKTARGAASWLKVQAPSAGIVLPRADTPYKLSSTWGGRRHAFEVVFTPALIEHLQKIGARVDLGTGELVMRDGTREDYTARTKYREDTKREPPPWLCFRPIYDVFGLPMEKIVFGMDAKTNTPSADFGGRLFVDFDVLVYEMQPPRVWTDAAMEPARDLEFQRKQLRPGLAISATTPEMMQKAAALFDEHCGPEAARWPARLGEMQQRRHALRTLLAGIRAAGAGKREAAPLIAEAKAAVAPNDKSKWTLDDARAAVRAELAFLKKGLKDVEIVVVPAGKHWTSMPQIKAEWPHYAAHPRPSNAANHFTETTRYLFLPEEDIRGTAQTSRHELNHLVFDRLDQKTLLEIRAIYDRLVANKGPFARVYGARWKELYTTFGEIFEGRHGPDALLAFKEKVGDLYDIISRIRHRRPA